MTTIQEFDFSVNLMRAILWQYNDAVNLQSLLQQKSDWYEINQKEFWENWNRDVFDLRTANDFGLQVWSIILNQPIFSTISPAGGSPAFGFASTSFNFGNGNFAQPDGDLYRLPTETARAVLQLRYFQITSSGTVPEINRILKYVFGKYGSAYLIDNHDMTQGYVFTFPVEDTLKYCLENFDILPRPAGVKSIITYGTVQPWGFSLTNNNFDNGNFGS